MSIAAQPDHPVRVSQLVVAGTEHVTPLMVRLVLVGDDLAQFESHQPDEHVKIVFPDTDGSVRPPRVVDGRLEWPRPFPPTREYTIRAFNRAAGELWIDFALHDTGLASDWVRTVEQGVQVWLAGPKPPLAAPTDCDRLVLFGDHTALPAIARWLEELPPATRAEVVVQIPADTERQVLAREVTWLVGNDTAALGSWLEQLAPSNDGRTFLWAAGEAGLLKPIRRWARTAGFARGTCDIAGYWRRGVTG